MGCEKMAKKAGKRLASLAKKANGTKKKKRTVPSKTKKTYIVKK